MNSRTSSRSNSVGLSRRSVMQRLVGDVRVVVMANRPRLVGEFDAHVAEAFAMAPRVRVVLVIPLDRGAEMDATERQKLIRAGLFEPPCAVLMDGAFARFVFSAVRWLGAANVKGFAPHDLEAACDFLEIPLSSRGSITAAIRELAADVCPARRLPVSPTVDIVQTTDRVKDVVAGRLERIRATAPACADASSGRNSCVPRSEREH